MKCFNTWTVSSIETLKTEFQQKSDKLPVVNCVAFPAEILLESEMHNLCKCRYVYFNGDNKKSNICHLITSNVKETIKTTK